MTPQLQQAIKLLQLSNLELAEFVEEQLEENPFLERTGEEPRNSEDPQPEQNAETTSIDLTNSEAVTEARESIDAEYEDLDPNSSGSDTAPDEYRTNDWTTTSSAKGAPGDDRAFDATLSKEISLADHLTEQLHVATRDAHTLFIGAYLIDLIDEAGYLREPLESVSERLGAELKDVEQTLHMIQTFEPCGIGARDLKECLRLQLEERDHLDPAMAAFVDNIELLANGDLKALMEKTGTDEEDVRDMIAEIRALTPKPGYAFGCEPVQAVIPDVIVRQAADGGWKIELNSETLPRVLVNQTYYTEISTSNCKVEDKEFLSEQFTNANWLVKSLDQRARTILKVASEIVRQQDAFFVYGVKQLRPLNLRAVADAISMHESTVSRVTSNKYMASPRGLFELKYFFTAAIASSSGGEAHSAEAVRCRIRELIDAETQGAVLSDDKIVEILKTEGVDIARRTVAKYRETLKIPSSVQRRRNYARARI